MFIAFSHVTPKNDLCFSTQANPVWVWQWSDGHAEGACKEWGQNCEVTTTSIVFWVTYDTTGFSESTQLKFDTHANLLCTILMMLQEKFKTWYLSWRVEEWNTQTLYLEISYQLAKTHVWRCTSV